ncbi:hypothetical protein, partial [Xanthomonas fragariae]|uniref:hypothetical protein n=1 Tax=Xanthomonas fragariae TaxID=48664 RepID=UPI001F1DFA27
ANARPPSNAAVRIFLFIYTAPSLGDKPIEASFLVKMLVTSRAIGAQIKPGSVKIALTVI